MSDVVKPQRKIKIMYAKMFYSWKPEIDFKEETATFSVLIDLHEYFFWGGKFI